MGRTFTAEELVDCGFISRILDIDGFHEKVLDLAKEAAKFSAEAVAVTKKLIRDVDRKELLKANEVEMEQLTERMKSKDSQDAIVNFVEDAKRKKAAKLAKQKSSKL
jgi:peroxisomal 3,2-trans-enoyl-CoA isomerase